MDEIVQEADGWITFDLIQPFGPWTIWSAFEAADRLKNDLALADLLRCAVR